MEQQEHITERLEYFVRSTVFGGRTLTELDADGAKKVTNVYTGSGILAEQRNFKGTGGGSDWSEVIWNHEDPVTGSYTMTARSGGIINTPDRPASAELDLFDERVPSYGRSFGGNCGG